MSQQQLLLRAVRGATTVEQDTPELIEAALNTLLQPLTQQNGIGEENTVTIFVTTTQDLHSISAARCVRQLLNWQQVPILSALEPHIEGQPQRCIRLLLQFYTEKSQVEIVPVYQNQACHLRPDLIPNAKS